MLTEERYHHLDTRGNLALILALYLIADVVDQIPRESELLSEFSLLFHWVIRTKCVNFKITNWVKLDELVQVFILVSTFECFDKFSF